MQKSKLWIRDPIFLASEEGASAVTNDDGKDPRSDTFTRRVCPGQSLGENSLFIITASLLACFDFLPPVDGEGKEIPLIPKFAEDLVR